MSDDDRPRVELYYEDGKLMLRPRNLPIWLVGMRSIADYLYKYHREEYDRVTREMEKASVLYEPKKEPVSHWDNEGDN